MSNGHRGGRPRILVVKLSSLGDLFHALPCVHNLKSALNAEVHWVTQTAYVELVGRFSDVARVIGFPRRDFWSHWRPFLRELRTCTYDVVVDLQGLLKSAVITRLARSKVRVGPSFHREGAGWFYSASAVGSGRDRHAVEKNLDVVRHLGLDVLPPQFDVSFPKSKVRGGPPRVAMAPHSRWHSKNWPAVCFAEVAARLRLVSGTALFLVGGPGDVAVCREVEEALGGAVVNLAGRTTLVEMGSVLADMDMLLSNDSGPGHMAAALGVPTLMVFGPTDPRRTAPYGDGNRVVQTSLPCRPCFSRICRRAGIPCLAGVTPEKVGEIALDILSRRGANRARRQAPSSP